MCEFEEYLFSCGCSQKRLSSYCHVARNDPNHQCFGIRKLRHVWEQQTDCKSCLAKRSAYATPCQQGAYASGWQQQQSHSQFR